MRVNETRSAVDDVGVACDNLDGGVVVRRFEVSAAVVGAFFFVGACTPPPSDIDRCDVSEGGTAQALASISPKVDYFLDASAGGPLTCHPGDDDGGGCDPCRGAPVELPIGAQTTLAVEVRNDSPVKATLFSVALADGSDDAFVVLAPVATAVLAVDAVDLFVGVTPVAEGLIDATLVVASDGGNGSGAPYEIGLQVVGVTP